MIKILLKLITVSVVFILVLELALFLAGIPKDYKRHPSPQQFEQVVSNPDIGYKYIPSYSFAFFYDRDPRGYFVHDSITYDINSSGFRGPEITLKKPDNTFRMFFLGDSFTFGNGVYFRDTYEEQFRVLAQQENLYGGEDVQSVNLGVGGFVTSQEYAVLAQAMKDGLTPDGVVVGYDMNDAEDPLLHFNSDHSVTRTINPIESASLAAEDFPWYVKYSRAARIIWEWGQGKTLTNITEEYYHHIYQDDSQSWQNTKAAIKNFGDYQKTTGTKVTFVIFPLLFDLQNYPFAVEEQKVKDELTKNGLGYVEIRPELSGYKTSDLWVHPTDQHPNEIVHKIAAEQLVKYFLTQKQ